MVEVVTAEHHALQLSAEPPQQLSAFSCQAEFEADRGAFCIKATWAPPQDTGVRAASLVYWPGGKRREMMRVPVDPNDGLYRIRGVSEGCYEVSAETESSAGSVISTRSVQVFVPALVTSAF